MKGLRWRWLAALVAASFLAAGAVLAAFQAPAPRVDLAGWVPQGALLSLETQDFAGLLDRWTSSPEKLAWMKSDNYAVFSRSHLFGRLQDVQAEFAGAAGLPIDGDLLKETAGRQTFFAWYDIGELQVVYITQLTPAQVSESRLWQRRKSFETREAGGVTFYVKTAGVEESGTSQGAADALPDSLATRGATKTVAFAESGGWLVLATGEDLMAQTLELMAAKDHTDENSLAGQGWYRDAKAAALKPESDLRMVLNMERVVKTPQFRTYWIQRNVTEMKHYKAVVADLYHNGDGMREERVLLPQAEAASDADTDLAPLAALAPDRTVVYRATAKPTAAEALEALQTKVLDRRMATYEDAAAAPVVALDTPRAGSVGDYETRIDEPVAVHAANQGGVPLLTTLLQGAALDGMMTLDGNGTDGRTEGVWTPFVAAVVLSSTKDWDLHAMQDAMQQAVQARLTAGSLGTAWQPRTANGATYFTMNDAHGLQLYVSGRLCIVADDPSLLAAIIERQAQAKSVKARQAMLLASFDHSVASGSFAQWTSIVDGLSRKDAVPPDTATTAERPDDTAAAFFGGDMKGLSQAFAAVKQEHVITWHDVAVVRQTVTYTWQR